MYYLLRPLPAIGLIMMLSIYFQGCYKCQMVTNDPENNNIIFSWNDNFPRTFSIRFLTSCDLANLWDSCDNEQWTVEVEPSVFAWLTIFPSTQEQRAATHLTGEGYASISVRINWDFAPTDGAVTFITVTSQKKEVFSVRVIIPPKPSE